jgi:transposase
MLKYITEAQFNSIQKFFLVKTGRPRLYDLFEIFNAILHILITGSQWRNLSSDYPPYRIVFYHYSRWKKNKTFHKILASIVTKKTIDGNANEISRILVIDNQSISDSDLPSNNSKSGTELKGYDGHKHRKGRKRCILVDKSGTIHCVKYFPANIHDTVCAKQIIEYYRLTPFGKNNNQKVILLGDKGFHSPNIQQWSKQYRIDYLPIPKTKTPDLTKKVGFDLWKEAYSYTIELNRGIRWAVERTFAWLQKYRRLNMNYERTVSSLETFTIIAGIRMKLRRC